MPEAPLPSEAADRRPRHHGRDPGDGRRRRRRAGRLAAGSRGSQRLHRAIDLGAWRGAAHRRDDLLSRILPNGRGGRVGGTGAGAGTDAGAGRCRSGDRLGTDGSGARDPARVGDARAQHVHLLHPPRFRDDREDRDGRRPRRCAGAVGDLPFGGAACGRRGHAGGGGADRRASQRGVAGRRRRVRRAADSARGVRGGDPSCGSGRGGQPCGLRCGVRCGERRVRGSGEGRADREPPPPLEGGGRGEGCEQHPTSTSPHRSANRLPQGEGDLNRTPTDRHHHRRRRAPPDGLPGRSLRAALPRPARIACNSTARCWRKPRATSRCG